MKKLLMTGLVSASLMLGGCATSMPVGSLLTSVNLPVTATGNKGESTKVGEASCTSILVLVATGDCSIDAAKKDGGITSVNHVDWKANNILGIIGNYKVVVHGN